MINTLARWIAVLGLTAAACEASAGDRVYPKTIRDINSVAVRYKLPIWMWTGYMPGNDERDSLHRGHRRATFIAHHEVSTETDHYYIVWFHGMNGFTDEFETRTFPVLKELVARGKSFTWIHPELPWSQNSTNISGRTAWARAGSFTKFVKASIATIPPVAYNKRTHYIIIGHSRGGKAIANAAERKDLCELAPKAVIWSDATYSDWLDRAWNGCLKTSMTSVEIWYLAGSETAQSATRVAKLIPSERLLLKPLVAPWYHRKIGNRIALMTKSL